MMQRSLLRTLFAACIFGVAGISLTAGILPVVFSRLFGINSFEIMLNFRSFVIPIALIWAVSGGILGWQGGARLGALIVGACGIVSGLILSLFALSGGVLLVLASILSGFIYGGIGGLIVGNAFPKTVSEV